MIDKGTLSNGAAISHLHGLYAVFLEQLDGAPAAEAWLVLVADLKHLSSYVFPDGVDLLKEALPELHDGPEALLQGVAHDVGLAASIQLHARDHHLLQGLLLSWHRRDISIEKVCSLIIQWSANWQHVLSICFNTSLAPILSIWSFNWQKYSWKTFVRIYSNLIVTYQPR